MSDERLLSLDLVHKGRDEDGVHAGRREHIHAHAVTPTEVRFPIAESVERLRVLVDEMVLVDDRDLLEAMGLAAQTLGLLLEPSGAAGLAAIQVHDLPGERLASVLTGSNLGPSS